MKSLLRSVAFAAALLSVAALWTGASRAAEPAAEGRIRILLTIGGHGFEEKPFYEMFDNLPGVEYTKAPMPESAALLKPGLETQYDAIVMYDMVPAIPPEAQQNFVKLLERGIGLVSLHHNLGAHRDWDEFRRIIGGKFILKECEIDGKAYPRSGWSHGEHLKITVADRDHPITKGLQDFEIHDETYNHYYTSPDVKVLLRTDHPKNDPEIAWAHQYGNSRVFYLMLGHDSKAWANPAYPELLLRGIRWTSGK
jgi:uncharacterized protein